MDDNIFPFPGHEYNNVYEFDFLLNACTSKKQCALIATVMAQAVIGAKITYDRGGVVEQIFHRDFIMAVHEFVSQLEIKAKTLPDK